MAQRTTKKIVTKKHLARVERERIQTRYILISSITIIVLVIGFVAYGLLDQFILKPRRPVAVVNQERISTREFQARVRYARQNTIDQIQQTIQFMELFGDNAEITSSFNTQVQQLAAQLAPTTMGQQMLDLLVDETLIRQEASRLGITATPEEVEAEIRSLFQYYPDGTPTPQPTESAIATSTLSPTQLALVPPTPTTTIVPTPTITATLTISPTTVVTETAPTPEITATTTQDSGPTPTLQPTSSPTPYSLEAFQANYQNYLSNLQNELRLTENDFRSIIENQIFRRKLTEAITADLTEEQEQVWARHILVADETTAQEVLDVLEAGEGFSEVAARFSTDPSNKDTGGDLGWFSRETMDPSFSEAAFDLEIGEISQPVESQFGWHIIQTLGHEVRVLTSSEIESLRQSTFQEWLDQARQEADIEIDEAWVDVVPAEPTLPPLSQ